MKTENTLALFPDKRGTEEMDGPKSNHAPGVARQVAIQGDTGQNLLKPKESTPCGSKRHSDHGSRNLEDERLLTVNEFADQLRVTTACVRKWILLRKIGVVKVGRLVRLRSSELRRIVDEGSRPPARQE